jgi:hypothetical protein
MMMKNILVLAALLCVLFQAANAQTLGPTASYSPSYSGSWSSSWTGSWTGTWSSSWTGSQSWSASQSWTGTVSSSWTGSQSWTGSNSYTISQTGSWSISQTITAALGYPQITGIANTINDLFSMNIVWQRPTNFNYQSYQLFLIINGTSLTLDNIPTENILLTAANTNGLVQPGSTYIVQVRGFLNGAFGPQSLPVQVSTSGGDFYGTVGIDSTSINQLSCNYYPQYLRCKWNTGSRPWINATFYVWCNRTVDPIKGAMAWIVQKVFNPTGSVTLPTTAVIPLPSGCRCSVHLTAFYATVVVVVDLDLTSAATGFVTTDKATIKPNTPIVVPT